MIITQSCHSVMASNRSATLGIHLGAANSTQNNLDDLQRFLFKELNNHRPAAHTVKEAKLQH